RARAAPGRSPRSGRSLPSRLSFSQVTPIAQAGSSLCGRGRSARGGDLGERAASVTAVGRVRVVELERGPGARLRLAPAVCAQHPRRGGFLRRRRRRRHRGGRRQRGRRRAGRSDAALGVLSAVTEKLLEALCHGAPEACNNPTIETRNPPVTRLARAVLAALMVAALAGPAAAQDLTPEERRTIEIFRRARPSVVFIT